MRRLVSTAGVAVIGGAGTMGLMPNALETLAPLVGLVHGGRTVPFLVVAVIGEAVAAELVSLVGLGL